MTGENIPNHVAIIVDGNGRWAEEQNKSRSAGHQEGAKNLDKVIDYAFKKGVNYLSIFVFSTENFKRSKAEVDFLMKLIKIKFKKDFVKFKKDKIKMVVSGRQEPLSKEILDIIDQIENDTKHFKGKVLNICLNYGGLSEIVDASKKMHQDIVNNKIKIEDVTEKNWQKYLYQDLPPIDFLIRTSGELRLSNFMLYQLAYAELYFPETYFPAFSEKDFDLALAEYQTRKRRFGGYNNGNTSV